MQHIRSAAPSTQNDDGGRQSSAPATKNATHLLKTTQKYCACHTKWLSTRLQTHENVTKCHACRKSTLQLALTPCNRIGFAISPMDTARPEENQRLETRHVGASKRAFRARLPPFFTLCSFKIDIFFSSFLMNLKNCYLKIDVSCEASVNFQYISQNATPATQFAPCRHLTQPWQCDSQKTRNTTRLKWCACHAKWRRRSPKCCACHEKCNSSFENDAKVLRLPHKTTVNTLWNVLKCHACHTKRGYAALETSKSDHFCRTRHRHGHTGLTRPQGHGCGRLRTVANGCERLRTVVGVNATFSQHTLHPQTPRVKRELLLRIREKFMKSGIFKIFTSRFIGIQPSMDMGVSENGRCAWHFVFFAFSEKPVWCQGSNGSVSWNN